MEHGTLRRASARSSAVREGGGRVAGPRTDALAGLAATLDAGPRIAQLKALSGVVQRVIAPLPGGFEATKQRLIAKNVPAEVVDEYQALASSFTEEEVEIAYKGPFKKAPKQSHFPKVVRVGGDEHVPEESLIYRGMSINNVKNLKASAQDEGDPNQVIFNAQNPLGHANAVQHIANDDRDSPYLSFEKSGYDISSGKYAPKPIGPGHSKPRGVSRLKGGFLKQRKSYTIETKKKYDQSSRVGYFGGVDPEGLETLDLSTEQLAQALDDPNQEDLALARKLAVADREVLLNPGAEGVPRSRVPFIGKVKQVTKQYFDQKKRLQTPTKALAFAKGKGKKVGDAEYFKLQIPAKYALNEPRYAFDVPPHLRRPEEAEDEISDVESIDLDLSRDDYSDYESDGDEAEQEQVAAHQVADDGQGGLPLGDMVEEQVDPLAAAQQQEADQQNVAQPNPLLEEHV